MSSFFRGLWDRPAYLSLLARYTVANGVFYLATGLVLFFAAAPIAQLVSAVEGFPLHDVGLVRVAGMAVAIIGWFYIAGGRTGATSFGLATVADRALVPLFLVPVWWLGEAPALLTLPFAVLDPILALGAIALWINEGPAPAPQGPGEA